MTTLHMDMPAVDATISAMKSTHGAMMEALNNANSSVSGLIGSGFQGPSAEQFRETFNQLYNNLQTQLTTLEELSSKLQFERNEWEVHGGKLG